MTTIVNGRGSRVRGALGVFALLSLGSLTPSCSSESASSSAPALDSGTPPFEAGAPTLDSGTPPFDAGAPSVDSGTAGSDAGRADAAADSGALLCGRYQVLVPGTGSASGGCPGSRCDGSGLVKDTTTGLTWARFSYYPGYPPGQTQAQAAAYCAGRGGRLPTRDEALAIAGNNFCQAAWPTGWYTWTSTSAGAGLAWGVYYDGVTDQSNVHGNDYYYALCVR
jgi:hypothetical protein